MSASPARDVDQLRRRSGLELIAVGVDGGAADCDAGLLASTIADAAGAEVILVTVHPDLPRAVERRLGSTSAKALAAVQAVRGSVAPDARTVVESGRSVAHALARVVAREQVDLLVVGSGRGAPERRVQIGRRTRQLLGAAPCTLAVAPRGLSQSKLELSVIGVGYDGKPEAAEALWQAGSLARAADARLRVRAVVDDRLPYMGVAPADGAELQEIWDDVVQPDVEPLRADAERASLATGADVGVEAGRLSDQGAAGPLARGRPVGDRVPALGVAGERAAGRHRRGVDALGVVLGDGQSSSAPALEGRAFRPSGRRSNFPPPSRRFDLSSST